MNNIPYNEFVTHWVANLMCHQDSGQIGRYIWMADSPTIDPIFLSDKNELVVKNSILHDQKQIFTSN